MGKQSSLDIAHMAHHELNARPREKGFAIDSCGTQRPEDTLHARRMDDGYVRFVGSVVEVGLLDREGESVRRIAQDLKKGKEPTRELPRERGSFTYRQRLPMPSISVIAVTDEEGAVADVDLCRTRVYSRRFRPDCKRLTTSEAYQTSMHVAKLLGAKAVNPQLDNSQAARKRNANGTVSAFARFFNSELTAWALQRNIPQIMRAYPTVIEQDGQTLSFSGFTAEQTPHAEFDAAHARWSTPCTDLETWVNMVNITSFLDENEAAVSSDEITLIADWMNQRKIARLLDRRQIA